METNLFINFNYHLKFRKYSNFLRILNLSLLSSSQVPRTFFCPRYPSPKSSALSSIFLRVSAIQASLIALNLASAPSGRGLTFATRAQKRCFASAKLKIAIQYYQMMVLGQKLVSKAQLQQLLPSKQSQVQDFRHLPNVREL